MVMKAIRQEFDAVTAAITAAGIPSTSLENILIGEQLCPDDTSVGANASKGSSTDETTEPYRHINNVRPDTVGAASGEENLSGSTTYNGVPNYGGTPITNSLV